MPASEGMPHPRSAAHGPAWPSEALHGIGVPVQPPLVALQPGKRSQSDAEQALVGVPVHAPVVPPLALLPPSPLVPPVALSPVPGWPPGVVWPPVPRWPPVPTPAPPPAPPEPAPVPPPPPPQPASHPTSASTPAPATLVPSLSDTMARISHAGPPGNRAFCREH